MVLSQKLNWIAWVVSLSPILLFGQGSTLPLGSSDYPILDRMSIKFGTSEQHFSSSLRGYSRGAVVKLAEYWDSLDSITSAKDIQDIKRLYLDNNEWIAASEIPVSIAARRQGVFQQVGEDSLGALYRLASSSQIEACIKDERYARCKKPIWGIFYPTPANWLEVNRPSFHLRINPLMHFQISKPDEGDVLFFNQRGIEIRGGIDDRLFFYTNITDTQARFPEYVNDFVAKYKAIPSNGFYKTYESSVFDSKNSYDFINGQGHIGFHATPHIRLEFGHGKNFIGNGYRSMLLSDFSHNYLYLKANWQVWRIHYQNLFTELTAISAQANPGGNYIPRKYMAAHYLSFDLTKNLTIGLYEATIFKRDTSSGDGFELQYLNPVILYRFAEHLLDSKDNILIGLDLKWEILNRFRLYGQFVLDEFKLSEIRARNGWWANKYGIQIGGQYIDFLGIDHLDFRLEYNSARPYTYTHSENVGANYSHYNQALAHPLGANFREALSTIRYQPFDKWQLNARFIHAEYGLDEEGQNWGGNILLDYETHEMEYGNEIGQGNFTKANLIGLNLSFEAWHNLFFDLDVFSRKLNSELPANDSKVGFIGLGFRWNTSSTNFDF